MKTKKIISILLTAIAVVIITSCGKNGNTAGRDMNAQTNVQSVLEQGMAAQDNADEPDNAVITDDEITDEQNDTNNEAAGEQTDMNDDAAGELSDTENENTGMQTGTDGVDVDLTVLSSTMVYSEVYDMMCYPENYIGKSVKMKGTYAGYHDESTDKYYHACIIQDATACCAQGIEFEPTDDYKYPDDYPAEGQEVCVTGVFDTYEEGENRYCTLKNARLD